MARRSGCVRAPRLLRLRLLTLVTAAAALGAGAAAQCGGAMVYTTANGVVSDGSLPGSNYEDGASCTYDIRPLGASTITIQFTQLELESCCDRVVLTPSSGSPVTVTATSVGTPYVFPVTSSVTVRFTSDSSINAGGWALEYTSDSSTQCTRSAPTELTTNSAGTLTDGSLPNAGMATHLQCLFVLGVPGALSQVVEFQRFNFDNEAELLVFRGDTGTGLIMARYQRNRPPPAGPITFAAGTISFRLTSGDTSPGSGFEVTYRAGVSVLAVALGVGLGLPAALVALSCFIGALRRRARRQAAARLATGVSLGAAQDAASSLRAQLTKVPLDTSDSAQSMEQRNSTYGVVPASPSPQPQYVPPAVDLQPQQQQQQQHPAFFVPAPPPPPPHWDDV